MKESILYDEGQKPDAIGLTKISEHAVTTDRLAIPPVAPAEPPRDNGKYNRAAIKRHTLKISEETRKGKFTRVSEAHCENIEALIEAKFIELRREVLSFGGKSVEVQEDFLTGAGKARLIAAFNQWIGNTIHRITKDVKVGKTF